MIDCEVPRAICGFRPVFVVRKPAVDHGRRLSLALPRLGKQALPTRPCLEAGQLARVPSTRRNHQINEVACRCRGPPILHNGLGDHPQRSVHLLPVRLSDPPSVPVIDDRHCPVAFGPGKDRGLSFAVRATRHTFDPANQRMEFANRIDMNHLKPIRAAPPWVANSSTTAAVVKFCQPSSLGPRAKLPSTSNRSILCAWTRGEASQASVTLTELAQQPSLETDPGKARREASPTLWTS